MGDGSSLGRQSACTSIYRSQAAPTDRRLGDGSSRGRQSARMSTFRPSAVPIDGHQCFCSPRPWLVRRRCPQHGASVMSTGSSQEQKHEALSYFIWYTRLTSVIIHHRSEHEDSIPQHEHGLSFLIESRRQKCTHKALDEATTQGLLEHRIFKAFQGTA